MSKQMLRQELCEGVYLNTITDAKFKSNRISCNLVLPLEEKTAADTAVVPFLLRKRFRECPDFTRLNQRLCELYGASLDADVRKFGAYQILNVSIQSLDDRYAMDGEPVTEECAKLVRGLLLDPYLVDGMFDAQDFELEKQNLIDTIESEINDKRDYAVTRCKSLMFQGEPFAVKKYGTPETARAVTLQSAMAAYRSALRRAAVEILFLGCGDPSGAARIFREGFQGLEREPIAITRAPVKLRADHVTEETERMDVTQSKLVMGFRVGERKDDDASNVTHLMCALYGGTPFSRLFLHVREEHSLCYYCAARFDRSTGAMLVDSGVEAQNKEKAQQEILKQLDVVRKGGFEEEELQNTILAMVGSLKSATDTLGGLEGWYLTQVLSGNNESPMESAEKMERITKEQVMEAAGKVTLDTVYFLTGKEGEANE